MMLLVEVVMGVVDSSRYESRHQGYNQDGRCYHLHKYMEQIQQETEVLRSHHLEENIQVFHIGQCEQEVCTLLGCHKQEVYKHFDHYEQEVCTYLG